MLRLGSLKRKIGFADKVVREEFLKKNCGGVFFFFEFFEKEEIAGVTHKKKHTVSQKEKNGKIRCLAYTQDL